MRTARPRSSAAARQPAATARENVATGRRRLVRRIRLAGDAAQRRRRKVDDLIMNTPADGLISGVATVNADNSCRGAAAW